MLLVTLPQTPLTLHKYPISVQVNPGKEVIQIHSTETMDILLCLLVSMCPAYTGTGPQQAGQDRSKWDEGITCHHPMTRQGVPGVYQLDPGLVGSTITHRSSPDYTAEILS